MESDSLRVAGVGDAILSDVVCITPKAHPANKKQIKSETLAALEDEKGLLESKRKVIDYQANLLLGYAGTLTGEHVAPDDMLSFLMNFVKLGESNAVTLTELNKEQREIEKKIAKEIEDPAEEHNDSHLRNMKVKLTINAEEDHDAEISLTYLARKASWTPVFDLRATTGPDGKPTDKISLHYRATVTQSTGEDWSDASLILSTASPSHFVTKVPRLNNIKIEPSRVHPVPSLSGQAHQQPSNNQNQSKSFGGATNSNTKNLFGAKPNAFSQPLPMFGNPPPHPPGPSMGFGTSGTVPASTGSGFPFSSGSGGGLFGASTGATFDQAYATNTATAAPNIADRSGTTDIGDRDDFEAVDANPLPDMEIPSAIAKENSMSVNFQVKGVTNIKSDGSSHRVAIAILHLTASVGSVVVPRSMEAAYLQCLIENSTSDMHLLPGNMSIYLDDGYISNTTVPHVGPGDSFKCTLGRDYSVGVSFEQKRKRIETQNTLFGMNRDRVLYTATLTLKNKRDTPIKGLIVRDVVPVSETPQVKVLLMKPQGLAEAEEGKDVEVKEGVKVRWLEAVDNKGGMKEGRHQWTVDLSSKETKQLVTEWEVSSVSGQSWYYLTED